MSNDLNYSKGVHLCATMMSIVILIICIDLARSNFFGFTSASELQELSSSLQNIQELSPEQVAPLKEVAKNLNLKNKAIPHTTLGLLLFLFITLSTLYGLAFYLQKMEQRKAIEKNQTYRCKEKIAAY